MRVKRKIKQIAKKILALLPVPVTRNQKYDAQTIQVMKKVLKPDSNTVDVGGHEGDILKEILQFAPNGQHYCFEPIPSFCSGLHRDFPNVNVHEIALSDHSGETTFQHVVSNPAYSGIKRRTYLGEEQVQTITVKTAPLDEIIPESVQISFIKIDVEGGEMGVIKGAERVIKTGKPVIVFEHGKGAADHYGTQPGDLFDLLTAYGLKVSLMKKWLSNGSSLSRNEFVNEFETGSNYYFIAHP